MKKLIGFIIGLIALLMVICIIRWKEKDSEVIVYENAYVNYVDGSKIYFYCDGSYYDYDFISNVKYKNCIADIKIKDEKIVYLGIKNDYVDCRLVSFGENYMCVEGYGNINMSGKIKFYEDLGSVKDMDFKEIMAAREYRFFLAEGKICSVVKNTVWDESYDKIRVLIKTSGYESMFHNIITFASDSLLTVNGVPYSDKEYELKLGDIEEGSVFCITSDSGIFLKNVLRNQENIVYRGDMYVTKTSEGLILVNELPVEEYLKLVLPSEMPYTYELEALKAQAVCARTYAYEHIKNPGLVKYGANLDDSVSFQVYGNLNNKERCDSAILATNGQVLSREDKLVNTNYYSTSCGYAADGMIWGDNVVNEAVTAKTINDKGETFSLDLETDFKEFITNENPKDYDYNYPYYRWSGTLCVEGIANLSGVGRIENIYVSKRLSCGSVSEITILGANGKYVVNNQYEIRSFLGKCGYDISNKKEKIKLSLLPSAFFYLEYKEGVCNIFGGGLGHGVGMSQNAANEMAAQNKTYDDILHFFFKESDITRMNATY